MKATKQIDIEITERDIAKGKAGDPCNCPVARGLRRAFHERVVSAGMGIMSVGPKKRRKRWRTPAAVTVFIDDFDEGRKVEPFTFHLQSESTYILPEGQKD